MISLIVGSCFPSFTSALANEDTYISVPYTIKPGETLYGISKTFYLTGDYERVARINGWNPKASLKAGTTLKLANPMVMDRYTVKPGDTLFAITNRYFNRNQYMNALMAYNRITDPNTGLKTGMAIRIPLPSGEAKHTVQKGETLYSLSVRYFKPQDYQQAIAQSNGIGAAQSVIKAGQVLQIPNPFYMTASSATTNSSAAGTSTGGSTAANSPTGGSVAGSATASPAKGSTANSGTAGGAAVVTSIKVRSIEIDITRNKLYLLLGGAVEKSFDIASGRAGLTPTGSFEIMTKIENPWYSAKGIPGGDPKNPLGSRWLGLSVPNTQGMKYGIHGTNAPASIGTNASAGCIRMRNEDAEWLFAEVPTGTKVTIHA
ncbi:LysM peptidoglycan-binding domain-containing protein [Paenibacillus rhizovicinus]|uniref:LysM peptidoglycan-binding domain-containing protein n=1 Tax=Paenibacillus rhizovicinus TaxID=2704463 RepID=A0A6C0P416_9BACL|nr:LysM peptidoglycan-binding domain-containing protein [Paenibacillus rhizovicinus]QHW31412.1 LysM peptidoglycan-binding domain-containing protein [Paenibacillus rhizovicinus]